MGVDREPIESLAGEELSAVSFVRDYVEFHFEEKVVRSLTRPTVTIHEVRHSFPEAGSRDALCSLIGGTVARIMVEPDIAIEIQFVGGASVCISLDLVRENTPEAAHFFRGVGMPMDVW